ncbi:MAG: hypothetical protein GX335_10020 [Firmicutes bacterium]|nr:hypothetical protein [Bacillota bacterium]
MVSQLYQQKLALFKELEQLSLESTQFSSSQLPAEDNLQKLEGLLGKRADLIKKIDVLDQKLAGLAEEKAKSGREVEVLKKSLQRIGTRIQSRDQKLKKALREGLGDLRLQAKELQKKRESGRAYSRGGDAGEGFFVDKRR